MCVPYLLDVVFGTGRCEERMTHVVFAEDATDAVSTMNILLDECWVGGRVASAIELDAREFAAWVAELRAAALAPANYPATEPGCPARRKSKAAATK